MQQVSQERPRGRLGNYTLTREAGRGGMSVVYEGVDDRIGRRVAIKAVTLPAHLSPQQRDEMIVRLRREARAIARLSNPHVVTVYDVGEQDGAHFLVMEYLDGQTLRERLNQIPIPPQEASHILDQVADALDAVHAEGVVHRDIKPSNVMLLPDGRVKLMDFGVARQTDDTLLTQVGMMVGSPAYMAPEIINGENGTRASDLWSLGVLLYQMLTGRPPFDSKNIPTVLYQVTHVDPEMPPEMPPRVQEVLLRALARNPARRYPSARALADAFRQSLPENARPTASVAATAPRTPRAARPRRSQVPLWAGALLLLAAVVGAAFFGHGLALHRHATLYVRQVSRKTPALRSARAVTPHRERPAHVRVADSRQERRSSHHPLRVRRVVTPPAVVTPHHRVASHPQARLPRPVQAASRPSLVRPRSEALPGPLSLRRRVAALPTADAGTRTLTPHATESSPRRRKPPAPRTPFRPKPLPKTVPVAAPGAEASSSSGTSLAARSLGGVWHGWQGIHSHDPAVLSIGRVHGSAFDGVMTIRTPEHATVRVALTGHVAPDGGVTMRETHILSSTKPHAWDLGFKTGRLGPNGRMSGTDHDVRGRTAHWSFSR